MGASAVFQASLASPRASRYYFGHKVQRRVAHVQIIFAVMLAPNSLTLFPTGHLDLPYGVSVEQVYADFLRYLLAHTQKFFEARTSEGVRVWRDLIDSADIILTHPNGWGLREQSVLRRAAIRADITSPANANDRIHFVSESEASVHFCLRHGDLLRRLKVRDAKRH